MLIKCQLERYHAKLYDNLTSLEAKAKQVLYGSKFYMLGTIQNTQKSIGELVRWIKSQGFIVCICTVQLVLAD